MPKRYQTLPSSGGSKRGWKGRRGNICSLGCRWWKPSRPASGGLKTPQQGNFS